MNHIMVSLTKYLFALFLFSQSACAESLSISNQDLIGMVQNPAPELETDCLECKNKKEQDLAEKLKEKVKPDWKDADIPKLCEEATKVGMEHWYGLEAGQLEKRLKNKDLGFVWANCGWDMSLYPSYDLRKENYKCAIREAAMSHRYNSKTELGEFGKNINIAEFLKGLPESDSDLTNWRSTEEAEKTLTFVGSGYKKLVVAKDVKKAKAAKSVLCAQYGVANLKSCLKGLDKITELMEPTNAWPLKTVIKEMYHDPDYNKASVKIALKIQSKVEKGGVPEGDFYSDVYESFLSLGLTAEAAEEKSFNLIGLLATRGPNIGVLAPVMSKDTVPLYYSMAVIASGMTVLNSASVASGHMYSYPPQVKGGCDNGKNYHFWMSAFLARKVAKLTDNSQAAISTAYLAQLGYQMKSTTTARDPNRAFMVDTFDVGNNKIRMDLAWAGAGAVYGTSVAEKKHLKSDLNVDEGLRKLLEDAGNKQNLEEKEAEKKWQGSGVKGYLRWRHIFSPDSSLDYYKKSR